MAVRSVSEIETELVRVRGAIDRFYDFKVASSSVNSRQIVRPAAEIFAQYLKRETDLCAELNKAELIAAGGPGGLTVKYGVPQR